MGLTANGWGLVVVACFWLDLVRRWCRGGWAWNWLTGVDEELRIGVSDAGGCDHLGL